MRNVPILFAFSVRHLVQLLESLRLYLASFSYVPQNTGHDIVKIDSILFQNVASYDIHGSQAVAIEELYQEVPRLSLIDICGLDDIPI
jgi:hypothetical protein